MRTLRFGAPAYRRWLEGLPRAGAGEPRVTAAARRIVEAVRREGDRALVRLTLRLDGVALEPGSIHVPAAEVRAVATRAERALVSSLRAMARRIERFHRRQRGRGFAIALPDGSRLEEVVAPLDSAGLYVPGGAAAYPSSVLMNAIPARVARVPRLAVATPPRALSENPALAAALVIAGLEDCVYRVGGAQAIAALAYGTESVPAVAKIVGPGNAWVVAAKRLVRGRVEIDNEAGPSELAILADASASVRLVAADLLAQAEHGSGDETVVLVTPSARLGRRVVERVAADLPGVANTAQARRALAAHGAVVLVRDLDEGVRAINELAAEHAQVIARGAEALARRVVAGSVFVGPHTPVALGDYGVGPSHVLPTGGSARFASPLSVRDFERRSSRVRMTRAGLLRVADDVMRVARAEGLRGHAESVRLRVGTSARARRGAGR
ncbi:MAG: histidinol dehydrogenase [Vicinamibacteria bacterium]